MGGEVGVKSDGTCQRLVGATTNQPFAQFRPREKLDTSCGVRSWPRLPNTSTRRLRLRFVSVACRSVGLGCACRDAGLRDCDGRTCCIRNRWQHRVPSEFCGRILCPPVRGAVHCITQHVVLLWSNWRRRQRRRLVGAGNSQLEAKNLEYYCFLRNTAVAVCVSGAAMATPPLPIPGCAFGGDCACHAAVSALQKVPNPSTNLTGSGRSRWQNWVQFLLGARLRRFRLCGFAETARSCFHSQCRNTSERKAGEQFNASLM